MTRSSTRNTPVRSTPYTAISDDNTDVNAPRSGDSSSVSKLGARDRLPLTKLISGGQTGVDRAALDAARELGLERGGWAPNGWRAEDGVIPLECREGMREHDRRDYVWRTHQNVRDGDATLIITFGQNMSRGTQLTWDLAMDERKPRWRIRVSPRGDVLDRVDDVREWLSVNHVRVLNVAGPRESKQRGIYAAARAALVGILRPLLLASTAACALEPAANTVSRPIIDVANEMCIAITGIEAIDGVCPATDIRCTPTRCCTDDWEYCCVGVPTPDGPVVVCG